MSYPPQHSDIHPLSAHFPEPWRSLARRYKQCQPRENQLIRDCFDVDRIASDLVAHLRSSEALCAEDARLRSIVRAQARFLRWIADNYKGVDLDIVRARANELDALAARGEAS